MMTRFLRFCAFVSMITALIGVGNGAAWAQPPNTERPVRKRFFIEAVPSSNATAVRAYCAAVLQRMGVAELVDSEAEADYILTPTSRAEISFSSTPHYRNEDRYTPEERQGSVRLPEPDYYEITISRVTWFECRIRTRQFEAVASLSGAKERFLGRERIWSQPRTVGVTGRLLNFQPTSTPYGHDDCDSLERNSGQFAFYQCLYNLCDMQAPVLAMDRKASHLTVALGRADGLRDKKDPGGVSELEIYALTGSLRDYVYRDARTGQLYTIARPTSDAQPNRPETWTYLPLDTPRGEERAALTGADTARLQPLGERLSDWAEVEELADDHCAVVLKRKRPLSRTADGKETRAKALDLTLVPLIARVRAKHSGDG